MSAAREHQRDLILSLATAWNRLERTLDASLSAARGISFSEYRILYPLTPILYLLASAVVVYSSAARYPLQAVYGLAIVLTGIPAYYLARGRFS